MSLSPEQRREYRAIAHNLKPVIIVGDKGLSEGLQEELERALNDHELIKLRIPAQPKKEKRAFNESLCNRHAAELVEAIGNVIVIYRRNAERDKFAAILG